MKQTFFNESSFYGFFYVNVVTIHGELNHTHVLMVHTKESLIVLLANCLLQTETHIDRHGYTDAGQIHIKLEILAKDLQHNTKRINRYY